MWNKDKSYIKAQQQCGNENEGKNDVVETRLQRHSVTGRSTEVNCPRNDQVPDHHKGQYNNCSDEESQHAPLHVGRKHNRTSRKRGRLRRPKAKRASGSYNGPTNNKGAREPTPKADGSKKWVPKNEPALEAVQKHLVP